LIKTELTAETSDRVSVDEIVYPPSTDLTQLGQDQPLAVFEREFAIGVRLRVTEGTPPGDLVVPVHLRYQACDASVCYPPTTAESQWTLHVVPANARLGPASHRGVFEAIAFGTGEKPTPATVIVPPVVPPKPAGTDPFAQLDKFTVLGTTGGYSGSDD